MMVYPSKSSLPLPNASHQKMSERSDADVAQLAWAQIESWVQQHSARGSSSLNGPASQVDLVAVESYTGLTLPEALRVVLTLNDGEVGSSVFGDGFEFLSSREIVEHWRAHLNVLEYLPADALTGRFDPEVMSECDSGVKCLIASRNWLPFADNNGNATRYIDFDPATGGRVGQVIEVDPESTTWRVLAPSFGAYLAEHVKNRRAADEW
jgi:cell wall assembly regulator SMI1